MSYSDDPENPPGTPGRGYTKENFPGDTRKQVLPATQQDPNVVSLPSPKTAPGQLTPGQAAPAPPSGPAPAPNQGIALQQPATAATPAAAVRPAVSAPVNTLAQPVPGVASHLVGPAATATATGTAPAAGSASTIAVGRERPSSSTEHLDMSFASGAGSQNVPATGKDMLLNTHGLVKIYDGRTVVDGVNINVKKGEIVGLLGPNGAGKTTSFYMIVGLVPPNGGNVLFDNKDVTKLPMFKRARLGMGYLPQEESIFRKLTVEENIMAVMQTMNYSRKEKKARCEELLERFGITHIRNNLAMTCSGGEKRRVTIARSLVPNPTLIMLDEPFSGVDPIAVNEIQQIVQDLRSAGLAILITDHNARQTLELVDRAYLIYEGRVLREGTKDFLVNDPVSRELYLGDRFTM